MRSGCHRSIGKRTTLRKPTCPCLSSSAGIVAQGLAPMPCVIAAAITAETRLAVNDERAPARSAFFRPGCRRRFGPHVRLARDRLEARIVLIRDEERDQPHLLQSAVVRIERV